MVTHPFSRYKVGYFEATHTDWMGEVNKLNLFKNKGFTYLELLVVLAVLGIVASIALNISKNVQESSKFKQVKAACEEIKNKKLLDFDPQDPKSLKISESSKGMLAQLSQSEKEKILLLDSIKTQCETNSPYIIANDLKDKK